MSFSYDFLFLLIQYYYIKMTMNDEILLEVNSRMKDTFWDSVNIDFHDERWDGRHFYLQIVSEKFEWKNRVARSQMVYQVLWDLLKKDHIHALRMSCKTPQEI